METRMLSRPWTRHFKRIGGIQSTYWGLALDLNASQSTICNHLKNLGKVSKLSIWVLHTLSEKNKENCISIATSLLSVRRNDPFLKNIITGGENWVFYDSIQYKRQWIDKDDSPQPIQKVKLHGRKVMLCVCVCLYGGGIIIHFKFLNCNQTLNPDSICYSQQQ